MRDKTIKLQNKLWRVEILPGSNGRVVKLVDRASGRAVVQPPPPQPGVIVEGGKAAFFGLECWPKWGDQPDLNTGVLSAFCPVRGQRFKAVRRKDEVAMTARGGGLRFRVAWRLPAGAAPLECRMAIENESAPADDFQLECFFIWYVAEAEWARTAAVLPGHAPMALKPYGELWFDAGPSAEGCAGLWKRGTGHGVALRARDGIARYFAGAQARQLILGPHSAVRRLAPGRSLDAAFEIAPLAWAKSRGWSTGAAAAEAALKAEEQERKTFVKRVGTLADWVKPAGKPALERRALHLTFQYAPVDLRTAVNTLEKIAAPCGFNQLMLEIGRAFPYRSHPKVAAPWVWSRAQWKEFVRAARGLGFELIPQYNALGHQGESGLATAYPELSEDANGWCLCPRQPRVLQCLRDIFDELIELTGPRCFHVGLDEADVPSSPPLFGLCPRCKGTDGGALFADHVLGMHAHLKRRGLETTMWADMLLHRPEHNMVHGLRPGTWKAIDRLPRDIVMIDWVYTPVKRYGGAEYLMKEGFRVTGATWHHPKAVEEFSRFAVSRGLHGMCATTWTAPVYRDLPLVCVLLAGKYFQTPAAGPHERIVNEAHALAAALAPKLRQAVAR